jgi:hypothetical protein
MLARLIDCGVERGNTSLISAAHDPGAWRDKAGDHESAWVIASN